MNRAFGIVARAALIASSALSVACAPSTPGSTNGAPAKSSGGTAPEFSLPDLEGKTVHLSDYLNGKNVVLIDFWSTTCDPCMAEMPHLVELYKSKKDAGLVVLAISLDGPESRAAVTSVAHDKDMVFPVLLDEETTVVSKFNPKRDMPFAVLIGKNGSVIMKRPGYNPGDEKLLSAEVDKALGE